MLVEHEKYWGLPQPQKQLCRGQKDKRKKEQAGAELSQAQTQLGFWELISFSFKVEN